jgi:hypothetical protein
MRRRLSRYFESLLPVLPLPLGLAVHEVDKFRVLAEYGHSQLQGRPERVQDMDAQFLTMTPVMPAMRQLTSPVWPGSQSN